MKKYFYLVVLSLLATACSVDRISDVAIGPQGEQGIPGQDGTDGVDGVDGANGSIITYEYFDVSEECPDGGVRFFIDTDGDLEITEICNGSDGEDGQDGTDGVDGQDGQSVTVVYEETEGGTIVIFGWIVDEEFVEITRIFVENGSDGQDGTDGQDGADGEDGFNIVMISGKHTEGEYAGETYVLLGLDTNRNGVLDVPSEVTNVLKIYDGEQGPKGDAGQDGSSVTFEITETEGNCYTVTFFIDGMVDEVLVLCDGEQGPPGPQGPAGEPGDGGDGIICTPDGIWTGELGYVFDIVTSKFIPTSNGGIFVSQVSVNGSSPVNILVSVNSSNAATFTNFVVDNVEFKNGKIKYFCFSNEYLDISVDNRRKYYTR